MGVAEEYKDGRIGKLKCCCMYSDVITLLCPFCGKIGSYGPLPQEITSQPVDNNLIRAFTTPG